MEVKGQLTGTKMFQNKRYNHGFTELIRIDGNKVIKNRSNILKIVEK